MLATWEEQRMKNRRRSSQRGSRIYKNPSTIRSKRFQIIKQTTPKFLTKSPFGIQTKRFASIGYHPDLDPTGSLTAHKQKLAPCDYFPRKHICSYKKAGSTWDKMIQLEEFSKNLGFRNANILEYRKFMNSIGGPGSYETQEEFYKKKSNSILKDCDFGKQPRFFQLPKNIPPPGTYFPNISKKTHFNSLPTFEWDGFVDRFKGLNANWKIAPNRYAPIDRGCLEMKIKPVSKKKLPYCLFSGQRDGTSIKNHFTPTLSCAPDKYYNWEEATGLNYLLNHPAKSRYGKFLKDQRFRVKPTMKIMMDDLATCYKDPNAPGPDTYNIKDGLKKLPPSKYPFNDSEQIARKGIKWELKPGPGRYNVKDYKCKSNDKRPSWVFKSVTGRTQYLPPIYTYF